MSPQAEASRRCFAAYRRVALIDARREVARVAPLVRREALSRGREGRPLVRAITAYLLAVRIEVPRVQVARALRCHRKNIQRMIARVEDRREADAGFDALVTQLEGRL